MGAQDKMMRSNKKFCRCNSVGHNQENCSIINEIRPASTRAQDKLKWKKEINEH